MHQIEIALLFNLIGWEISDVNQYRITCKDQAEHGGPKEEGEWLRCGKVPAENGAN